MAGWKKYFKTVAVDNVSPISGKNSEYGTNHTNWQSTLPEIYIGHPNRIERYSQLEQMDADSEINAALDILAEFCSQVNDKNNTAFDVVFKETPTDNEIKIIKEQLVEWNAINEFNRRMFKIVRNVLKFGDQVLIRDPETFKLFWTEMSKVTKIIVNETNGKEPEQYFIKDLGVNLQNLTATAITVSDTYSANPQLTGGGYVQSKQPYTGGGRFTHERNEVAINAEHIVHCSLTEGLDAFWPFGNSVLENIFKVYKQKELLEDSIIIYRIQRAPERRIFKIDVGNMPSHMAMAFVERVKNEIHQRRIPSQTGGGSSIVDSTYNTIGQNEDFFFPTTADGRGSSVEVLPGGTNLGEITDLRFFTNKLFRGLRIPSSYLPTEAEDGQSTFNDGKATTALIQEWRFNQYCKRLQSRISSTFDHEFKMFMRWRGITIDNSLFEIKFPEPQNFAKYRQAELDTTHISSYTQLEQIPYLSKRFLLKRYLGLTEEEMLENETMWAEEQTDGPQDSAQGADLRSVGVTPGGIAGDLGNIDDLSSDDMGGAGMEDVAGEPPAAPGAPPSAPSPA